jgi:hypothetical protein
MAGTLDPALRGALLTEVEDPEIREIIAATALVESGGRLDAAGDAGRSHGPYQEYDLGRGKGLAIVQRRDPVGSTRRAEAEFLAFHRRGFRGAELAYRAQRPADRAGYIRKITAALPEARRQLGRAPLAASGTASETITTPAVAPRIVSTRSISPSAASSAAIASALGGFARRPRLNIMAGGQPARTEILSRQAPAQTSASERYEPLAGDGTYDWAHDLARRFGLTVGSTFRSPAENARVGGSPTSAHKTRGGATDFTGTPDAMRAFALWAIRSGKFREVFYDPVGQWDQGRFSPKGIGGHGDHVHVTR